MMSEIFALLVMLNPFAIFLYIEPIRKALDYKNLIKVIFKASLISFIILILFFLFGNAFFENYLKINFESFRIFGGFIIIVFAFQYIMKGKEALISMKEDLDDLASEIALPFMVGAGTISVSILMSKSLNIFVGFFVMALVFILNFIILISLINLRMLIDKKKFKIAFDKNMGILIRLNGFFIGAIGVDMIITSLKNIFFN